MTIAEAKLLPWGTYGKHPSGDIWLLGTEPLRWTTLGELDDEHLRNILTTQPQITVEYRDAIEMIIDDRMAPNEAVTT